MKRILVIGDCISDVYTNCKFKKMCPDDPTVRAIIALSNNSMPGGAANVALNLIEMTDAAVDLIGILDEDTARQIKFSSKFKIDMGECIIERQMLVKQRFVENGKTTLRVDNFSQYGTWFDEQITNRLTRYFFNHDPDLIVFCDYDARTVGEEAFPQLLDRRERLLVDTKLSDLRIFGGQDKTLLVKLNDGEWKDALSVDPYPELNFRFTVVTHGADGASLIWPIPSANGSITNRLDVQAHPVDQVDVCGCGDTFMAGLAAGFIRGMDPFIALQYANAAAATVVGRRGTAIVDCDMIDRLLKR